MKKKLLTRFAIVRDHIPERKHSKKTETEKENILKGRMQILIERLEDITISGKNKRLRFGNSSEALGNHLPDGIEPGQQFFVISSLATRKTYAYPCHLYELDDDLSKFCAVTVVDSDYTKPVLNLQDNGLLDAKRLEKDIKQKEGFIAQNIPYYGETSPTAKVISEEFLTQHYLLKTVFSGSMLIISTLGVYSLIGFQMSNILFSMLWAIPLGVRAYSNFVNYSDFAKENFTITHEIALGTLPPKKFSDRLWRRVEVQSVHDKTIVVNRDLVIEQDMEFYLVQPNKGKAMLCFPCKNYILDTRTRNILTAGSKKNI